MVDSVCSDGQHEFGDLGKKEGEFVLLGGGVVEQLIEPLGLEQSFQNGTCQNAHGSLLQERFKGCGDHKQTSIRDIHN
jgi:hypothetical protein